jgi:hypothetical protein
VLEFVISRPDYESLVLPFVGKPMAKVFTGLRRVAKRGLFTLLRERLQARAENRGRVVAVDMESPAWLLGG